MNKVFTCFGLLMMVLLVTSCDDDYYDKLYGGANNVKMLEKIDSAGINVADFAVGDFGLLHHVTLDEDSTSVINVYYSEGNISEMIIDESSANRREIEFLYDTTGKIITAKETVYENDLQKIFFDSELTYASGKLINILRKRKTTAYPLHTFYENVTLDYAGSNVSKITEEYGTVTNGLLEAADGAIVHTFNNYDDKKSALRTLPIQFTIGMGILSTRHLEGISHNNVKSKTITKDGTTLYSTPSITYDYDKQNHPTSQQPGNLTYTYQTIVLEN